MKRLVERGMGIGCLPREYAMRRLGEGTFFELDVRPEMPSRAVGLALPAHANLSFAARAFIALLNE